MRNFIVGFVSALALIALVGLCFALWGIDVAATSKPGMIDAFMLRASARAVRRMAPDENNPFGADAAALPVGLSHFKANCLSCHGAPGVEAAELAKGLQPPAPDLTSMSTQGLSDGQLFWVISNGIKMTGMPAFSPTHEKDEIWKVVAFVRHLPALSNAEKSALAAGTEEQEGHHHDAESSADSEKAPAIPGQLVLKGEIAGHLSTLTVVGNAVVVKITEKNGSPPHSAADASVTLAAGGKTQEVKLAATGTKGVFTGTADLKGAQEIDANLLVSLDGKQRSAHLKATRP